MLLLDFRGLLGGQGHGAPAEVQHGIEAAKLVGGKKFIQVEHAHGWRPRAEHDLVAKTTKVAGQTRCQSSLAAADCDPHAVKIVGSRGLPRDAGAGRAILVVLSRGRSGGRGLTSACPLVPDHAPSRFL